jgi:hypothetical protein
VVLFVCYKVWHLLMTVVDMCEVQELSMPIRYPCHSYVYVCVCMCVFLFCVYVCMYVKENIHITKDSTGG